MIQDGRPNLRPGAPGGSEEMMAIAIAKYPVRKHPVRTQPPHPQAGTRWVAGRYTLEGELVLGYLDFGLNTQVLFHLQRGQPLLAIFGMKQLRGALSGEGRAARARRFAIVTPLRPLNIDIEELQTVLAVAQLIFRIHVMAAAGTDERTQSLWMIDVESVTAYPTFVHLDVTITIIDHIPGTTFAAYHLIPPLQPFSSYLLQGVQR
jgi:hypothetical protein